MAKALEELLWLDMSGDAQGLLDKSNCEVTVGEPVAESAAVASEAQLATAQYQYVTNIPPPPPAAKL